ncbi:elongation factor 1 alpha-like protein [Rhodotorula toruloides]|uniref:Elongation factor 1 alpha-like protein n=1 Tax=Rhodotorula toruloides TaxID=5286 RepID=A0A511KC31_RHOTO|nr:elongation factor 1 alpha-like protein [Rhodotorula toruloides]
MSRHRAVKNLDLDDELDDGACDEGGDYYEDMTSEQQAQMAQALSAVQAVLGTDSNIPDKSIRDALWDSYFDVEGTIAYLLDEQHKKEARRKKEEGSATPPPLYVPPTPSLASLSLDKSSEPALLSSSAQPAPKNKLAAITAANRAAKATAPAFSSTPSLAPPAPAPTVQAAPPPEKKLSKLQQKMLSSRAASPVHCNSALPLILPTFSDPRAGRGGVDGGSSFLRRVRPEATSWGAGTTGGWIVES